MHVCAGITAACGLCACLESHVQGLNRIVCLQLAAAAKVPADAVTYLGALLPHESDPAQLIDSLASQTADITHSPASYGHPSAHVCHLWLLARLLAAASEGESCAGDEEKRAFVARVWRAVASSISAWLQARVSFVPASSGAPSGTPWNKVSAADNPGDAQAGTRTDGSEPSAGMNDVADCASPALSASGSSGDTTQPGSRSSSGSSDGCSSTASDHTHTVQLVAGTRPADIAAAVVAGWMLVAAGVPGQWHKEDGSEQQRHVASSGVAGPPYSSGCDTSSPTVSHATSQAHSQSTSCETDSHDALLLQLSEIVHAGACASAWNMIQEVEAAGGLERTGLVPPLDGWTAMMYRFDVFGLYSKVGWGEDVHGPRSPCRLQVAPSCKHDASRLLAHMQCGSGHGPTGH